MAFIVIPDEEQANLPTSRRGPVTPPDLAALREGKTIFLPESSENKKRLNALRSVWNHTRKRKGETRLLTARRYTWQGASGHIIWTYEPPTEPTET